MLMIDWRTVLEITLLSLFLIAVVVGASILLIRSLIASYKEVFRSQSRFDIELRKTLNLMSKLIDDPLVNEYANLPIKDLTFDQKKTILKYITEMMTQFEESKPEHHYLHETFENLQEVRRNRDSHALIYNQKAMMFPFSVFVKIMKLPHYQIYTDNL